MRTKNIISEEDSELFKNQITSGQLVNKVGTDTDSFNEAMNNFFYGGNMDMLGEFVSGDMFKDLLTEMNEKNLLAVNEDGMFEFEPESKQELEEGIQDIDNRIREREANAGNRPVSKSFYLGQERSRAAGESVLSSIPVVSYLTGQSDKFWGDEYWQHQFTEDLAK